MGDIAIDMTGRKCGRLTVLGRGIGPDPKRAYWLCRCECGAELTVLGKHLRNGNTRSCGCYKRDRTIEVRTTHGMTGTRAYRTWCAMVGRGTNPNLSCAEYYIDINVHPRYRVFENFLADLGEPPNGMSIDRIDNAKSYEPGNLRWANATTQNRNKRNNLLVTFEGETRCLAEWCELRGMNYNRTKQRLYRGWTPEEAFSTLIYDTYGNPSSL